MSTCIQIVRDNFRVPLGVRAILLGLALIPSSLCAETLQVASAGLGSSTATVAIAIQLGYFRDLGLDVTLFDAGGGDNAVATVLSRDAQVASVGLRNASKPIEKGQPLKVISVDTQGFQQVIVIRADLIKKLSLSSSDSMAKKGAALRGLKIAVNDIGGSSGDLARYALAAAGLTDRDATIINMNSPAGREAALRTGRIDGIVGTPPDPEIAEAGGYGVALVDPVRDMPDLGVIASSVEVVRSDYLQKNRPALVRYFHALARARALIRTDSEAAKKAFYAFLKTQNRGSLLSDKVNDLVWRDSERAFAKSPELTSKQLDDSRKFFSIPSSLTFSTLVDNSVIDAAR